MQTVAVSAQTRVDFGKKASAEIRKNGMVPAVLYSKEGVSHMVINPKEIKPLLYTPDFKLAEITVDGSTYKAIVKDAQFHPVSDNVMHIDFLKLIDGHPIVCNVPVIFKGASPGVKLGGKLVQTMRRATIKTIPEHLVDKLEGDISEMNLGDSLRIRDLEVSEKIEIMNPPATPVALVEVPRSARTGGDEDEEGGEEAPEGGEEAPAAE